MTRPSIWVHAGIFTLDVSFLIANSINIIPARKVGEIIVHNRSFDDSLHSSEYTSSEKFSKRVLNYQINNFVDVTIENDGYEYFGEIVSCTAVFYTERIALLITRINSKKKTARAK